MKTTHTHRIGAALLLAAVFYALMPAGAQEADEETKARARALQAGMTGELLVNGDFSQWDGSRPVGWGIWNPIKGCKVVPGPTGPSGAPSLELVPDDAGFVDVTARVRAANGMLHAGDCLLVTLTLKADQGVPMEILMTVVHGENAGEKTAAKLPFKGDGNWNTLQYTLPALPPNPDRVELAIRIRGAKEGTAYVSRASLRVLPPVT
jgi:hypothetical protein